MATKSGDKPNQPRRWGLEQHRQIQHGELATVCVEPSEESLSNVSIDRSGNGGSSFLEGSGAEHRLAPQLIFTWRSKPAPDVWWRFRNGVGISGIDGCGARRLPYRVFRVGSQTLKLESTDNEAIDPSLLPGSSDPKQTVIPIATLRGQRAVSFVAADDSNRRAALEANPQAKVPSLPRLISNLPLCLRIIAALPGVDDAITLVDIIDVPARKDDRIAALAVAVDAGLKRPMQTGIA